MGMRKYFDHAFEGFCNSMEQYVLFAVNIAKVVIIAVIYITIPIWIIPYCIFTGRKESK